MHVESMERKMREMQGGVDADEALAMGAHTVCQFPCCPFSFRVPVSVAIFLLRLARPLNCDGGDRCARVSASVCWDAMRGESHPLLLRPRATRPEGGWGVSERQGRGPG